MPKGRMAGGLEKTNGDHMTGKIPKSVGAIVAALAILALSASMASAEVIYNNIPKPKPRNTGSIGFEATSTSEFGGAVGFAGTARNNPTVSIVLSSWACEQGSGTSCKTSMGATFSWPVTVKVYNVGPGGSVGSQIDRIDADAHNPVSAVG